MFKEARDDERQEILVWCAVMVPDFPAHLSIANQSFDSLFSGVPRSSGVFVADERRRLLLMVETSLERHSRRCGAAFLTRLRAGC